MCNENSTTNSPRQRSRSFCLTSYLNVEQIKEVLFRHDRQIKAYAFIVHDKDINPDGTPKEIHIHLLLRTVTNITLDNVRNWFKGFYDSNHLPINTLGQIMHDISSSFDYLTHNTEQAIKDGKFLYSPDNIISNDINYFKDTSIQDIDNITLALDEMCSGVPIKDIAMKYGRDFIIHFHSIKEIFNAIQLQEGGKLL